MHTDLSPTQLRVLQLLARKPSDDCDVEIACCRGQAWIGEERFSMRTVYALLRLVLLRDESDHGDQTFRRYVINGTGRDLLAGYFTVDELRQAIYRGKPFSTGRRGIKYL